MRYLFQNGSAIQWKSNGLSNGRCLSLSTYIGKTWTSHFLSLGLLFSSLKETHLPFARPRSWCTCKNIVSCEVLTPREAECQHGEWLSCPVIAVLQRPEWQSLKPEPEFVVSREYINSEHPYAKESMGRIHKSWSGLMSYCNFSSVGENSSCCFDFRW